MRWLSVRFALFLFCFCFVEGAVRARGEEEEEEIRDRDVPKYLIGLAMKCSACTWMGGLDTKLRGPEEEMG